MFTHVQVLSLHRKRLNSDSKPAAMPARRSPLASGVLGAVGGRHDVLAGDERASTPVLSAALAVQVDGRHPWPLAGPGHVTTHHPELGRLGHAAGWPPGAQVSQVRSGQRLRDLCSGRV